MALVARNDETALAELYDRVGRQGVRPRIPGPAGRPARRGRRAGSIPRRLAHGGRLPGRAGEGDYLDPHACASSRRRPRSPRRATPGGAPRRSGPRHRLRQNPPRTPRGFDSSASASRTALRQLPQRAARGHRACVLRRLFTVRAVRKARGSLWVRSRAGCSPGLRVCASFCRTEPRKGHGKLHPRADCRLRAGRARPCREGSLRGPISSDCKLVPGGGRVVLGDHRRLSPSLPTAPHRARRSATGSSEAARAEKQNVVPIDSRRRVSPVLASVTAIAATVAIGLGIYGVLLNKRPRPDESRADGAAERRHRAGQIRIRRPSRCSPVQAI